MWWGFVLVAVCFCSGFAPTLCLCRRRVHSGRVGQSTTLREHCWCLKESNWLAQGRVREKGLSQEGLAVKSALAVCQQVKSPELDFTSVTFSSAQPRGAVEGVRGQPPLGREQELYEQHHPCLKGKSYHVTYEILFSPERLFSCPKIEAEKNEVLE